MLKLLLKSVFFTSLPLCFALFSHASDEYPRDTTPDETLTSHPHPTPATQISSIDIEAGIAVDNTTDSLLNFSKGDRRPQQNDLPTVTIAAATADEGSNVEFTVTLSAAAPQAVEFKFATSIESTDTAEATDFTAVTTSTGSGSITAGETTTTIAVTTSTDTIDEPNETFTVTLSSVTPATVAVLGSPSTATGTINDTSPIPTITIGDATDVTEGQAKPTLMRFPITLAGSSENEIILTYRDVTISNVANAEWAIDYKFPSDFSPPSGDFSIAPLTTATHFEVTILDDDVYEVNSPETVAVRFAVKSTGLAKLATANSVKAKILENEKPPTVSIDDTETTFDEGTKFGVTLNFSGSVDADYKVTLVVEDGTASSSDYTQDKTLLDVGQLQKRSIEFEDVVTLSNDDHYEGVKQLDLSLSAVTPAGYATVDASEVIKFTITDSTHIPRVSINDADAREGNPVTFRINMTQKASKDVGVKYNIRSGTAGMSDFSFFRGTRSVDIEAGDTRANISIATTQDTLYEVDETFVINLVEVDTDLEGIRILGQKSVGTGTIIADNDSAPTVSISAPAADTEESKKMTFSLSLSKASGATTTVPFTLTGTAASADYKIDTPSPIEIEKGETSANIEFSTIDDEDIESDETIIVTLGTPTGATLVNNRKTATGTINDNDSFPNLSVADASASEGDSASLTISTPITSTSVINGTWTTADDTAESASDYTAVSSGTFSIAANASSTTISVVTTEDAIYEGDESFTVTIESSDTSIARVADGTATVTIKEDESIPTIDLGPNVSASEGEAVVFRVNMAPAAQHPVSFQYRTTISTAVATDFTQVLVPTSTTVPAGSKRGTISVATTEDTLFERDENFLVTILAVKGVKVGSRSNAVGTIVNDDVRPVASISAPTTTNYTEGDKATDTSTATFNVSLNTASGLPAKVVVAADSDSEATVGKDFNLPDVTTITVPAGRTSANLPITIVGDDIYEGNETLTVSIASTAGGNATIGTNDTASVSIVENEPVPVLSATAVTLDEDDGPAEVMVTTATKSAVKLDFKYVTVPGTASASDFTHVGTKTAVSLPAEALRTKIDIAITDDTIHEPATESLSVTFSDLTPVGKATWSSEATTLSTTVTIEDGDPLPKLSVVNARGDEGDAINVMVTLTNPSAQDITFSWKTSDSTAVAADGDYTPQSTAKSETIDAGDTSFTISIATGDNDIDEPDSAFNVIVSSSDTDVSVDDGMAIATIVDDEKTPVISFMETSESASEPADGAEAITHSLVVTMSPRSHQAISIPFEVSMTSTASVTSDYTVTSSSPLTIPAKGSSVNLILSLVGDGLYEGEESIDIALTSPTPSGAATLHADDAEAEVLIQDNEPLPHVTFKETAITVEEGEDVTLDLEMTPVADVPVPVRIDTRTGALYSGSDDDITPISNRTVTFAKGVTKQSTKLATINDLFHEVDETIGVTISAKGVPLRALTTGRTAVVTIKSEDSIPNLISIGGLVREGATRVFIPTLSHPTHEVTTIKYAFLGSAEARRFTATAGLDFVAAPKDASITFPALQTTPTSSITLKTIDDAIVEGPETLGLRLFDAPSHVTLPSRETVYHIDDNDRTSSSVVSLASTVTEVNEDRGTTNVELTVSLDRVTNVQITVPFTLKGTATEGADYSVITPAGGSRSVTLTSGARSRKIILSILDDTLRETDETIIVELGKISGATGSGSHTITIKDNEPDPTVAISNATAVAEGDDSTKTKDMTFDLELSYATAKTVTVPYTLGGTAASGDDYRSHAENASVTINPMGLTASIVVAIEADELHEGDETVTVTLGSPTNATVATDKGVGSGTITDDDRAPYVAIADPSVVLENDDGDANKPMTFPVSLDKTAALKVTVPYTISSTGSVIDDFVGHGDDPTIDIEVGDDSADIVVQIVGDDISESEEEITITLGVPTNATINPAEGSGTATGKIADNDDLPHVSVADATAKEEGDATTGPSLVFAVSTDKESGLPITVPYTLSGSATSGTDFVAHPSDASVSIAAGETSVDIEVVITGDLDEEENETVIVTLGTPTNANLSPEEGAGTGTGTITDDDPTPTVTVADAADVTEGDDADDESTLSFSVSLDVEAKKIVTIPYSLTGTAASGIDYVSHGSSPSVTIAVGEESVDIEVEVIGDFNDEDDETVIVTLGTPTNGKLPSGGSSATGTIEDDDTIPTVSVSDAGNINEGDSSSAGPTMSFPVSLDVAASQSVTVPFTLSGTATSTVDFVAPDASITISAGGSSGTISVQIIGDLIDESDETIIVTLSAPTNAQLPTGGSSATGTIVDDDALPSVSIEDAPEVTEGSSGDPNPVLSFAVSLSSPAKLPATIPFTVTGDATNGSDFIALPASPSLSLAAGDSSGTIEVEVIADDEDEEDESVIITLGSPTNANLSSNAADNTATGIILDDDTANFLSITNPAPVLEGNADSTVDVTWTIQLTEDATEYLTINYELGGTAMEGEDYSIDEEQRELRIAESETSTSISATILGDAMDEGDETIEITLLNTEGLVLSPTASVGTVTIQNDDIPPLTFSVNSLSVDEGGESSYTFTVSHAPSEAFSITPVLSTEDEVTITEAVNITPENWSEGGEISISVGEDSDAQEERYRLEHVVAPIKFEATMLPDVVFKVNEKDTDGLEPSTTSLSVEESASTSYSIHLLAQPLADVSIRPLPDRSDALTVTQPLITFTPENWSESQEIEVHASDNGASVNNRVLIEHDAFGSGYERLTLPSIMVEISDSDQLRVVLTSTSIVLDEGGSTRYSVALSEAPQGDVTVTPESSNTTALTVSDPLTFNAQNWRTRQYVTVSSNENDDTGDQTLTINHTVSGEISIDDTPTLAVRIVDNDIPGISIDRQFLSVVEGNRSYYRVALSSSPNEDVVVRISIPEVEIAEQLFVTEELTFTSDNWDEPQDVLVVAHSDNVAEETLLVSIQHEASGGEYSNVPNVVVAASIIDDDVLGLETSTSSLFVLEDGSAQYDLRLTSEPTDDVIVTPLIVEELGSAALVEFNAASSTLLFTPRNWDISQTITITGLSGDTQDQLDLTIAHQAQGGGYDEFIEKTMAISYFDRDSFSFVVYPQSLRLSPGSTSTYFISASSEPVSDVVIAIELSPDSAVDIPSQVVITPQNWQTPQPVSVSLSKDIAERGVDMATVSHSIAEGPFAEFGLPDLALHLDYDEPQLSVSQESILLTEGQSQDIQLTLSAPPASTLRVVPQIADPQFVEIEPSEVEFDPKGWSEPKTVQVNALENDELGIVRSTIDWHFAEVEGDHPVGVVAARTAFVSFDNDSPTLITDISTTRIVEGASKDYQLRLGSQPSGEVTVEISSQLDTLEIEPANLVFDVSNWMDFQTVTINALMDDDDLSAMTEINHHVSGGGYQDVNTFPIEVHLIDDDMPGLSFASQLAVHEGSSNTYEIALTSSPHASVTVMPLVSNSSILTVQPSSLTFDPQNWHEPQVVTVTAAEDEEAANLQATIQHVVRGSQYGGLRTPDLRVQVLDNDEPAVYVSPMALTILEGESSSYTVVLQTQPTDNVNLAVESSDSSVLQILQENIEFTPTNWNVAQVVDLQSSANSIDSDREITILHQAMGGGYDEVDVGSVMVELEDVDPISAQPAVLSISVGETASYTVSIKQDPQQTLIIMPFASESDTLDVTPASVTIAEGDWSEPIRFEVSTHSQLEPPSVSRSLEIVHSVRTAQDEVIDAESAIVQVVIEAQESASQVAASIAMVSEDAAFVEFSLSERPTHPVVIVPATNHDQVSFSPTNLRFEPESGVHYQTLAINGHGHSLEDDFVRKFVQNVDVVSEDSRFDGSAISITEIHDTRRAHHVTQAILDPISSAFARRNMDQVSDCIDAAMRQATSDLNSPRRRATDDETNSADRIFDGLTNKSRSAYGQARNRSVDVSTPLSDRIMLCSGMSESTTSSQQDVSLRSRVSSRHVGGGIWLNDRYFTGVDLGFDRYRIDWNDSLGSGTSDIQLRVVNPYLASFANDSKNRRWIMASVGRGTMCVTDALDEPIGYSLHYKGIGGGASWQLPVLPAVELHSEGWLSRTLASADNRKHLADVSVQSHAMRMRGEGEWSLPLANQLQLNTTISSGFLKDSSLDSAGFENVLGLQFAKRSSGFSAELQLQSLTTFDRSYSSVGLGGQVEYRTQDCCARQGPWINMSFGNGFRPLATGGPTHRDLSESISRQESTFDNGSSWEVKTGWHTDWRWNTLPLRPALYVNRRGQSREYDVGFENVIEHGSFFEIKSRLGSQLSEDGGARPEILIELDLNW